MDKNQRLKQLLDSYQKWVVSNPNLVTDVETAATWSSYFIAGKINKSPIVSELVYLLSKLVSLFNDRLIREAHGDNIQYYGYRDQIKLWLTITHYCEVFVELVVKKRWGTRGKWTAATLIQCFKCSLGLMLLYKFKELPLQHPPIAALQRKKFTEAKEKDDDASGSFTLKRSGRVVRCVDGAPPVAFRDWQPIKLKDNITSDNENKDLIYAECLHILKPIIHLLSMRAFGTKAWKQWLVSLSMDIASLKLYNHHLKHLTYEQRLEISRRKLGLVLYLMRSPMYNGYSKNVIESVLTSVSKKIPLMAFISGPIIQYLSHWQDIYFYMWAS